MDTPLSSLSVAALGFVEDQLYNNDVSSDAELLDHFIRHDLTLIQAWQALTYRDLYLCNIYLEGFTPILKGANALRFNPYTRRYE